MGTVQINSGFGSQTLVEQPSIAAPSEQVDSVWDTLKSYLWNSPDKPKAQSAFVGDGHRLGGSTDLNDSMVDKESMITARLKTFGGEATAEATKFSPRDHRTAKTTRSCMRGSRTAARAAEIKAQGVKWDQEGSTQDVLEPVASESADLADCKWDDTSPDSTKEEKGVIRSDLATQPIERKRSESYDTLRWVPTSNWTLDWSKGRFDTLHKYGANWEDEGKVDPEDLDKWRKEMQTRSYKGYITMEELDRLWGNTLGKHGDRLQVTSDGMEAVSDWETDHSQMVNAGYKLLCRDDHQRDSYLGRYDMDSVEDLKRSMHNAREDKKKQRAKTVRNVSEGYRLHESDLHYVSCLKTALDDLEQFLTDATDSNHTAKTAQETYKDKLRKKRYLVPFEMNELYNALKQGTKYSQLRKTLAAECPRSTATSGASESDSASRAPSDKGRRKRWKTQSRTMFKRDQKLVLPSSTENGTSSTVFERLQPGILERGRDLISRLKSLKSTDTSFDNPAGSRSWSFGQSDEFEVDPLMRRSDSNEKTAL